MRELASITGEILDAAVKLHMRLGPGLLESVYEAVLAQDLRRRGLFIERQPVVHFRIDGITFRDGLRPDLLVERAVVVELKSIKEIAPVHLKQVLTYLRVLDLRVGLLLNFGAPTMMEGFRRLVNDYADP